jgi:Predicted phosphatase homologous to the C-terminal domain of histone macroH2A1
MPLKIVRNDITKLNTEVIVDKADKLPDEEEKIRNYYRKNLDMAAEKGINSIAIPLIITTNFGFPKEEGMRIAVDEVNTFLLKQDILIYLVVDDEKKASNGDRIYPGLKEYIDKNYEDENKYPNYGDVFFDAAPESPRYQSSSPKPRGVKRKLDLGLGKLFKAKSAKESKPYTESMPAFSMEEEYEEADKSESFDEDMVYADECALYEDVEIETKLKERMKHLSDTFSEYLLYLIQEKSMSNADVYKRAIVDKKTFSKIKNNPDYHPNKLTALCLCVGARLNLDESKDLLARAGYALSPCDKTDIIFSFFIENEIYDMIELDIQLEEHGLPCIIY